MMLWVFRWNFNLQMKNWQWWLGKSSQLSCTFKTSQLSIRMSSSDFRRTINLKGECLVGKHLNIQPGLSVCPRTWLENVCRFDWVCMLCCLLDMECIRKLVSFKFKSISLIHWALYGNHVVLKYLWILCISFWCRKRAVCINFSMNFKDFDLPIVRIYVYVA